MVSEKKSKVKFICVLNLKLKLSLFRLKINCKFLYIKIKQRTLQWKRNRFFKYIKRTQNLINVIYYDINYLGFWEFVTLFRDINWGLGSFRRTQET